jgi:hypothetical protein
MKKITEKQVIKIFEHLFEKHTPWINLRQVAFETPQWLLEKNRKIYVEGIEGFDADEYTIDEMLVEILLTTFDQVPVERNVEALVYLIDRFWCVPAATRGGIVKQQLTAESVTACLETIRDALSRQTFDFPKHLLREFAIDLFSWGKGCNPHRALPEDLRTFMQDLYNDMDLAKYTRKKAAADLARLTKPEQS